MICSCMRYLKPKTATIKKSNWAIFNKELFEKYMVDYFSMEKNRAGLFTNMS